MIATSVDYVTIDCDSASAMIKEQKELEAKNDLIWNNLKEEDILSLEVSDIFKGREDICNNKSYHCMYKVTIVFKNGVTFSNLYFPKKIYENKFVFNRLTDEQKEHILFKKDMPLVSGC